MKPSFHIKAATEYNPANSILLMIAGTRHCSFAIMNYLSKELVEFGYYTSAEDENDYKDFFEGIESLNSRYYQTAIGYDANESVQIPSVIYKYEDGQLNLDAAYGKNVHTTVISENIPGWNLYNIYRLPSSLHMAISWKFLSAKSWSINSVLLKGYSSKNEEGMVIDFKTDEFSIVVLKNSKLLLANTFMYTSPEDVLYYLLKCCHQLNLSQQMVRISLSGLIEKDSAVYRELHKYFINLQFESLSADVKLAEALTVHPEHYFSSISKLAACVL
ncbi:MAG TPA: DUF3822 family protein [Chitinophagaceae bacterium]|nr:DUF3822 family protein [Chitinophagaceae bacterium]